ncbi:S8 family serine peptidase [Natronorubrum sp. JWXQ-INN-674]|uniref:S8 family serine peptidase n=1 Tax=Natronorubrum halalkaliphilum TaxID=2691917 RepID=A0A6B0VRE1_9EURY|nr:S8 family peptidase [Natronorubrum halalkaliphilum]MXV63069.1 S8 family serine peptidase [Natronorubrum halalkaliphilum]
MTEENISRRTILRSVGAGVAGTALAGHATAGSGEVDDYVVGIAPDRGLETVREAADSVRRELDFGEIGRAVSGQFPDAALEAFENNPNVRYVEKNARMQALEQTTPYGIEQVDADVAIDDGSTGDGVSIAIIDSGIDPQHETLEANLGEGWAATDAACQDDCSGGFFCSPNDIDTCYAEWDDDNDHGTHVAGTAGAADDGEGVLGVAPDATLHAVKVLDCCGSGAYDDIAAGIEWSADQGHEVQNMSLGGDESNVVADAVAYAAERGVTMIAAAGNDGECTDCVGYPAAYDEVIAVSATDENDDLADFSSTGPEVELAAPGVDTLSSIPRDDYDEFSGTSMASPHVAGGAAQIIAAGTTDREEVRQQLKDAADDIGLDDNEQGAGRLNVADALGLDDSDDDDDDDDDDETDSESEPAIDEFAVSTRSTGRWNRAEVDWAVSDEDGDLASVTSELVADDGTVLDSVTSSVGGSSASGEHELRSDAEPDGVRLVVSDEAGNETSDTRAY